MPTLNRRYRVALVMLILAGGRCQTPGGPFVTVTITGIPAETTKMTMGAMLGDDMRSVEATPTANTLPLTIDLPPGSRGPLVVSTQALFAGPPACTLATGTVTVELDDDTAYQASLALADSPLAGCTGVNTVGLTVNKSETGGIGSVVSNPAGINCATGCTQQVARYRPGTQVTLTAKPAIGSQVTWSDPSCGVAHACVVTVTKDTTLTATFTPCASGTWCNEGSPDVTGNLYGVWGIPGGSVYAVGEAGTIVIRSNAQWTQMTSGVTVPLHAIGGESATKTVYAGGDSGTLLNLTGAATWSAITSPVPDKQIVGLGGENNGFINPNLTVYLCTADGGFFYKGGTGAWTAISDGALAGKVLHGLGATDSVLGREATVVGDAGFVLRRTDSLAGKKTADNTSGSTTTAALRGVWSGSSLTVAVGDNGTIITRGTGDYGNGSKTWKAVASPVTSRLNAVWGGDDKNIWIVGDGGVILKYDGNAGVTKLPNVPTVDLSGVWAADTNQANVYAVGKNGVILHYAP